MKRILLAATALGVVLTAPAIAADLPGRKAPVGPPPPPPPMWTGFYGGLNAGGTFGESNGVLVTGSPVATPFDTGILLALAGGLPVQAQSGFLGGGQIGYNYQFSSLVAGLEADIQGIAGSSGSASAVRAGAYSLAAGTNAFANQSAAPKLDYLGTVRGRIGYLATPSLLVYGTGGLAYGQASLTTNAGVSYAGVSSAVGFGSASISDTRVGWTAGGGFEWMFLPHWSAKLEYLFYDLGSLTASGQVSTIAAGALSPAQSAATSYQARYNGHIVRAGLNYHFNWIPLPAPVVAKY
jgi:outer membrane immunogenic protein